MGKKEKAFNVQPRDLLDIVAHNEVLSLQTALEEDKDAVLAYRDQYGVSALHTATVANHPVIVQMLINSGIDVDAQADSGATALHLAADLGLLGIVEILMAANARLDLLNRDFELPIQMARRNTHSRIVVAMSGAIEPRLSQSSDVFSAATSGDYLYFVNVLDTSKLEVGQYFFTPVELSSVNEAQGDTVLTTIAGLETLGDGHRSTMEMLVARKAAPINKPNGKRMTPLMLAAKMGHNDMVRLLLKHGADPTLEYDPEEHSVARTLAKDEELRLELAVAESQTKFETLYEQRNIIAFEQRAAFVEDISKIRKSLWKAQKALDSFRAAQYAPPADESVAEGAAAADPTAAPPVSA